MNQAHDLDAATNGDDVAAALAEEAAATPSSVADAIEYPLDPSSVIVERLAGLIFVAALTIPSLFAVVLVAVFASLPPIVKPLLLAAWFLSASLLTLWAASWPQVRHRHIRYRTDDNGFTIRRGVLWRGVTSIPRARVQHIDVVQGPMQRRYGLAKLVIHTAGTQDASVSLSGLPHAAALRIRDFLIDDRDANGG